MPKKRDGAVIAAGAGVVVSVLSLSFAIFQFYHSRDLDDRVKTAQAALANQDLALKKEQLAIEELNRRGVSDRSLAELGRRIDRSFQRLQWVRQLRWTDATTSSDVYHLQPVTYAGGHIAEIIKELDHGDESAPDLKGASFNELIGRLDGGSESQRTVELRTAYGQLLTIRTNSQSNAVAERDVLGFLQQIEPILQRMKMAWLGSYPISPTR